MESVVHECVHSHRERDESLFHTHTHTRKEEENDSTDSFRSGSHRQMHHPREQPSNWITTKEIYIYEKCSKIKILFLDITLIKKNNFKQNFMCINLTIY